MVENVIDNLLRRIVDVTGITSQTELANSLGINRSAITHARNNGRIPDKWIMALYRKFGLSPKWIESGIGRAFINGDSVSDVEFKFIPRVSAILSAGNGSLEVESTIDDHLCFSSKWLRSKGSIANMVAMTVSGDSMHPDIRDGDIVLIDQANNKIVNRKIYAVGIDDAIFIKRLEKHPENLVLCSDNPLYAPVYINKNETDHVRILGKVIWSSRDYR